MKVINANLNEGGSKPDKIKIIPISGKIKKIRLSM